MDGRQRYRLDKPDNDNLVFFNNLKSFGRFFHLAIEGS